LFLVACALYAINRWLVKPWCAAPLVQNWFNDFLLIACALPPLLWAQRRLKLREHNRFPSWGEIGLYLAIWSALFEWVGPKVIPGATGDVWDVVAYALGGIVAGWWWNRDRARV
jgi:hypothetical protein